MGARLPDKVRAAGRVARRLYWELRPRGEDNAFAAVRARFYRMFWREAAAAAGAELHELGSGYWQARRMRRRALIRGDQIGLDDHLRVRLVRDKTLTARLLAPLGFVTPESVTFDPGSLEEGLAFLAAARGPVVVKPDGVPQGRFAVPDGPGAGRGVTCGVRTGAEFRRAARRAAVFGSRLIAEKQIEGASYRLLYLDGQLIDAVRRDPPRVFGDGISTIAELMHAQNAERRAARPAMALSALRADLDCRLALERQQLRLGSVPAPLQPVTVKTACNENAAFDNHVACGRIHPELARLGGELVRYVGLRLAGVDIMSRDPAQTPSAQTVVFNEINANPGLHHHWLVAEAERRAPVGRLVLEAALS